MPNIHHIQSISEFNELMGYPKPTHPLIALVDLSKVELPNSGGGKFTSAFYSISLKTKYTNAPVLYGQRYLDFQEGVLLGMAPNQVMSIEGSIKAGDMQGWALYFHPDLIAGYALQGSIEKLGFFEYSTNEALHLSDSEKENLNDIAQKIKHECELNIDDYSNDLLVANLDLLLNYIKRYYGRQFKTRKAVNSDLLSNFEQMIKAYFDSNEGEQRGLPSVRYFSDKLNLSASYFSDLLKKETGKSALDHVHLEVIKRAKQMLLNSEASVAQIAYELGFEHPPYFSRLFKKKTGKTPSEFREVLD